MRQKVHLHVWDSRSHCWCGPNELKFTAQNSIMEKLRDLPASWYGKLNCRISGEPTMDFHTTLHDLRDSGVALIDVPHSTGGPLEVVSVIPSQRMARIREDFAFDFVSFLKFLGVANQGSELPIHDYVELALKETAPSISTIFSVDRGTLEWDLSIPISRYIENLSMGMLQWLTERDRVATLLARNGPVHAGKD